MKIVLKFLKEKWKLMLTKLGGKLYMDKLNTKLMPLKNPHFRKKQQENHDQINK